MDSYHLNHTIFPKACSLPVIKATTCWVMHSPGSTRYAHRRYQTLWSKGKKMRVRSNNEHRRLCIVAVFFPENPRSGHRLAKRRKWSDTISSIATTAYKDYNTKSKKTSVLNSLKHTKPSKPLFLYCSIIS